jgi:hypothetical protein
MEVGSGVKVIVGEGTGVPVKDGVKVLVTVAVGDFWGVGVLDMIATIGIRVFVGIWKVGVRVGSKAGTM